MNGPAGFLLGFWIMVCVGMYIEHVERMEELRATTARCTIHETPGD